MRNNEQPQTIKEFMKQNLYFFILAGVLIVFSLVVIIATLSSSDNKTITNNTQTNNQTNTPVTSTVTYYLPVLNASIAKDYSATELQYNATLNQWEAHKSIDFLASAGSEVRSITSGVVKDVYTNYLEGTVITIEHNNGLVSQYGSLDENIKVKKGDKVDANAVIGYVSASANAESNEGAHLHFTMYDIEGKKIDPAGYLDISNK